MSARYLPSLLFAVLVSLASAPLALGAPAAPRAGAPGDATARRGACLPFNKGYLRARIHGALDLEVDLRGGALHCEGGPRPDGSGILMSFEGRLPGNGERLTMVFGIGGAREGRSGRELPTNLTVILGTGRQLFATQGERNCTVDRLRAERIGRRHGPTRSYRIAARGFCIAPANDLAGKRRILVTRFDFAGRAVFRGPAH